MGDTLSLNIHDINQFSNIANVGEQFKHMVIDRIIEDDGDTIRITFIIDKNKGKNK